MKSNRFNYPNQFGLGSGLSRLIQDAFDGLEDLGGAFANPSAGSTKNTPHADLFEDEHHYHVRLELPGVSKSDIKLELVEGTLVVSATISKETSEGRKNFPLNRSVPLPDKIGEADVSAKLEDGVLTVSLPKAEEVKPREITVE
ncbi:MAG: HSP20 family protein [Verrucomicrobiales bacterium]|jgi:HSP20 family protein